MRLLSIAIVVSLVACATGQTPEQMAANQPARDSAGNYIIEPPKPVRYSDELQAQHKAAAEQSAQELLAVAAESETTCGKLVVYGDLLAQYPETRAAKFARRNYAKFESQAVTIMNRVARRINTMRDSELTEMIENTAQLLAHCPEGKISKLGAKHMETAQTVRLKKYGY